MSEAISVRDLHVRYRGKSGTMVEAVRGLSFEVKQGEMVGFLGPNGAGKSSTLKALMGFLIPTAGTAQIFGLEAGSLDAKKRVGYLPEVALYYPYLTPFETLTLYGELQGLKGRSLKKEVGDLLDLVGLGQTSGKQNRQLSKGMLQRVGIAQSLLGRPELLILDEVTSGLDPVGRRELRSLMKERQKEGATLFFSSHELAEVDMLCDRILLIHQGQMIEEREMQELKQTLRHYRLVTTEFEKTFNSQEELIAAIEEAKSAGSKILDVVSQEGSLEDYFVETVCKVGLTYQSTPSSSSTKTEKAV